MTTIEDLQRLARETLYAQHGQLRVISTGEGFLYELSGVPSALMEATAYLNLMDAPPATRAMVADARERRDRQFAVVMCMGLMLLAMIALAASEKIKRALDHEPIACVVSDRA